IRTSISPPRAFCRSPSAPWWSSPGPGWSSPVCGRGRTRGWRCSARLRCRSARRIPPAYLHRIRLLLRRRRPDLLWVEKEALPWLPWRLEQAMLDTGVPVLLDLDDSQFHRYDQHEWWLARRLFGDKI